MNANFPLVQEIPVISVVDAFAKLGQEKAILLDSASPTQQGRYSFIGFAPFDWLELSGQEPFTQLQLALEKFALSAIAELPPFQGGIAGMFGYELGGTLEAIPAFLSDQPFPDIMVGFYDLVIAWDHQQNRCWIFSSGFPELDPTLRQQHASERLKWARHLLDEPVEQPPIPAQFCCHPIKANFTQAEYMQTVERVQAYIRAGDIFQANLTQRFSSIIADDVLPWDIYRALRQKNPAPFAAFMQYQDKAIISASPERFIRLHNQQVETRPIKGTVRRDPCPEIDAQLGEQLLTSEKDRAENIMIVDLLRNDLSRVCQPHSVTVQQLCGLESFATVHHLVSAIKGILMPARNAIDLLKATFPGGSITGAPKIRAMQIIAELEPTRRGPYCGSIGYIAFNGDLDLSITIRTFVLKGRHITFHAGGAITIDSDPLQEYQEAVLKAQALKITLTTTTQTPQPCELAAVISEDAV